ncbi:winged helix-turn-helix domain-containing protein, partial [Streptococcus suis]
NQLVAKVAAHLKREERYRNAESNESVIRELFPLTFYLQEKLVCVNGEAISLTKREYDILELLSSKTNKVYTREEIYECVYDDEADALFR